MERTELREVGLGRPVPDPVRVRPDQARYPDLVSGNNRRWRAHPRYVEVVGDTRQVVRAVEHAVRTGRRISVRSGGHCYEDFVYHADAEVVIDLSEMRGVHFDAAMGAFAIEPGATLLQVYERLYRTWGVTIPGGSCYSVGAGGHIVGGGYGTLSRKLGLTVDHLYAVEVVVVDARGSAEAVIATREPDDPNRGLWWAHTGGGGGNFGIVTKYWMRSPDVDTDDPTGLLPAPPAELLLNAVALPYDALSEAEFAVLVKNFGAWHEANSDPDGPYAGLCAFLVLPHRTAGAALVIAQMDGTRPDSEDLLRRFLEDVTAGVDVRPTPVDFGIGEFGPMVEIATPQRFPWLNGVRFLATNTPVLTSPTLRAEHKSAYHRRSLTDEQIAALRRHLTNDDTTNPNAMAMLISFGGKANVPGPDDTAVAQRDSVFKALYQVFWDREEDDAANLAWIRALYADVYARTGGVPVPDELTDGCYVNYPDTDLGDSTHNKSGVPWHALYYKDHYARLQQVKGRWDPLDVFRHAQSVELPEVDHANT
ncbi:FAD-binding protein [Saccharothrix sp. 6-C]|uniref:FAD-binding oxidoreductase n=1 Tax=Saccharothrix sp. 6-C TaxID=2781735 RepID=UPI001916CCDD|nr:FAD-binding protein [Saccharothrix sp. 6-C]QQQ79559.1 FAD-binding protein [Saccharothrix sp. 6-C]